MVGRTIYQHDSVAARATDALLAKTGGSVQPAKGWIIVERDGRLVVLFVFANDSGVMIAHEVVMATGTDAAAAVKTFDPPVPADPVSSSMFLARQTAIKTSFHRCSASYNTVVLPASLLHKQGWLVYLLAAHLRQGEIVAGGHYRVLVSPDGRQVVETSPVSKDCMTFPPRGGGGPMPFATNLVLDSPSEIHVFLSLLHRRPFVLLTVNNDMLWTVDGENNCIQGEPCSRHRGSAGK